MGAVGSVLLRARSGRGDSVGGVGGHGVGGIVGSILVAAGATRAINGVAKGQPVGLVDGNAGQILIQLYGVAVIGALCAVAAWVILKIVDALAGR